MFPITVLIGATAAVFAPMQGSVYALLGTLVNALAIQFHQAVELDHRLADFHTWRDVALSAFGEKALNK